MKQEKIVEVLREMISRLSVLFQQTADTFDKDTIHEFRLEFKRLREFLQLLRLHVEDNNLQLPKNLKELYHIAGKIRDSQLEIDILTENLPDTDDTIQQLKKDIQFEIEEWRKSYSPKLVSRLDSKFARVRYENVPTVALSNFFGVRVSDISAVNVHGSMIDDEPDNIKKHIRDIIYASEAARRNWNASGEETAKKMLVK